MEKEKHEYKVGKEGDGYKTYIGKKKSSKSEALKKVMGRFKKKC